MVDDLLLDLLVGDEPYWRELFTRLVAADGRAGGRVRAYRRLRVCRLLVEGYSQEEIAADLGVSVNTVGLDVAMVRRVLRPDGERRAA